MVIQNCLNLKITPTNSSEKPRNIVYLKEKGEEMINKVILIGNLGADVEIRHTQSGTPVASFNLATTERWKGQDGQQQEETEWHRIVAWKRLAEICGEYLTKGSRVYIEGKLQTRKWQDQNGNDRYTTEIVAREMKMISPRNENGGQEQQGFHNPPPMGGGLGSMPDDVPFAPIN